MTWTLSPINAYGDRWVLKIGGLLAAQTDYRTFGQRHVLEIFRDPRTGKQWESTEQAREWLDRVMGEG